MESLVRRPSAKHVNLVVKYRMPVYVDCARIPAKLGRWPARWSHLVADSGEELHNFAALLGLRREWFQEHSRIPHYDLTDAKRKEALAAGALPVSSRDIVRMFSPKRK